jgi:hypothetical protein
MKNILILTLLTIGMFAHSCKKEKSCDKVECDLEGTYKIEVSATKHLPFLFYSNSALDFKHLNKDGFIYYDTSQNVCCETYDFYNYKCNCIYPVNYPYSCPLPRKYTLSGVKISKSDDRFYLNSYKSTTTPTYSDLPLTISSNAVNYQMPNDFALGYKDLIVILNSIIGVTADEDWAKNLNIRFVELNLKKIKNGVYKGNWVFIKDSRGSCELYLSNGSKTDYRIAEFAEVTFTKM